MTTELILDNPVKGHLYALQNQIYKYAIQQGQEIQVSLSTDQFNQTSVLGYISVDEYNQEPDEEVNSGVLVAANAYKINYRDLSNNECYQSSQQCYVYINIYALDDVYYKVSVV